MVEQFILSRMAALAWGLTSLVWVIAYVWYAVDDPYNIETPMNAVGFTIVPPLINYWALHRSRKILVYGNGDCGLPVTVAIISSFLFLTALLL